MYAKKILKKLNNGVINEEIFNEYQDVFGKFIESIPAEELEVIRRVNRLLNNSDVLELLKAAEDVFLLESFNIKAIYNILSDIADNTLDEGIFDNCDITEKLEIIYSLMESEETYEQTIEIMEEREIFSYTRLQKIACNNLEDEIACPALLIALEEYYNIDVAIDSLWEVARDMIVLGNNKANAAKDWYYETSCIDKEIIDTIDSDLYIDWEESFEIIFNGCTTIKHDGIFYAKIS